MKNYGNNTIFSWFYDFFVASLLDHAALSLRKRDINN